MTGCQLKQSTNQFSGKAGEVKLIVLNPGHFHATLLLKNQLEQVNDSVLVYAPIGKELEQFLLTMEGFNQRTENPTSWKEKVYDGEDFLEKMLAEKKGNVVLLTGNNKEKTENILLSVNNGFNVLGDKPMAINKDDFNQLVKAFKDAEEKNVQLYDLMTERFDVLNMIEKKLINNTDLFGKLQQGTQDDPAIQMESVHHFYKEVAGKPLIRPAWYYDVEQQGEGIADVTTHLIDLVNWKCFPEQEIDYTKDVKVLDATHWATELSLSDYTKSTGFDAFPEYLNKYIDNSKIKVNSNGTINYKIKGNNVSLKVLWNFEAPNGGGDTFTSKIKGTKAKLITIQDGASKFVKQLYVEKADNVTNEAFKLNLDKVINEIKKEFPAVSLQEENGKFMVNIPVEIRTNHEEHFSNVAKNYFSFLVNRNMPKWEVTNTLAKYYITTTAVELANQKK